MNTVKAIICISITNNTPFVIQSLLALGVDPIYEITGKYDLQVSIAAELTTLNTIIDKIKAIDGVVSTDSVIVLKEINNE